MRFLDRLGIIMRLCTTINEKVTVEVILNECSEVKNLSQQILRRSLLRMTEISDFP